MAQISWSSLRRAAASLASLAIVWIFVDMTRANHVTPDRAPIIGAIIAVPALAAGAIWIPRVGAQLLARGLWWSLLLFGTAALVDTPPADARTPALIACFAAAALLSAGREALNAGPGRFQPVAFRGTLMLALVLAMADVAIFFSAGLGIAVETGRLTMLLLAAPMLAGVVGLLRLRTWGLLVSLVTNVTVATLVIARLLDLPDQLRPLFVASACLQLIIPVPMLITILRRRPPGPDRWPQVKRIATTTVLLALAGFAIYTAFIRQSAFRYW